MADLIITITIPDSARVDFLDAYADRFGWVNQATSGTKAAFARDKARDIVRDTLRWWRQNQAAKQVEATPDGITAT